MWQGQNKVWLQFRRDILATDIHSGIFLSDYLKHASIHGIHTRCLEVADLQRYKLVKAPNKVKAVLNDRSFVPFIFVFGKN
jgi:hypothetical protein